MTKISNQYSLTNILTADLANSRLGINNVSPTVALDVTGAGKFSSTLQSNGGFIQANQTEIFASAGASNRAYAFSVGNVAAGDFTISQGSTATGGTYTTRLTINPSGNVGIGTSAPSAGKLVISGDNSGATTNTQLHINTISSQVSLTSYDIVANVNKRFTIYSSDIRLASLGSGTVSSNVDGVLSGSDGRLKNKTRLLENGLSKVLQLVPTYYKWKEDSPFYTKEDYEELGFIAQEVSSIIPEASPEPEGHKVKNYHDRAIIAVLVKAIQELSAKVSLLENK